MKKMIKFVGICVTFFVTQSVLAASMHSPVGYWKTIDDMTGKTKAIVQIWEANNHQLYGKITQVFPEPGESEFCIACQGENHNKPILGMVILSSLKQNSNNVGAWSNGEILDPKNGKTYHCNVQVNNGGQNLNVRGYIGMPLFGRSQTWIRVDSAKG